MSDGLVAALASNSSIAARPCQIRRVRWVQETAPCVHCGLAAPRVWDAQRTAIDLDMEAPVLLRVTVSVHRCPRCRYHWRAQPPFLRPDAIYLNRVVAKALQAVYVDGLAIRRVPERLARDCGVRPHEASIRAWCRHYGTQLESQESYLSGVVEEFSGILCVDEVYQGDVALLLAVDPAAPTGDRLVGYELVTGAVDNAAMAAFLHRLREAGIAPDQIITDGSALYPAVLAEVWPIAAHQLCLFHETRHVTKAALAVLTMAGRTLPIPPPHPRSGRGGPLTPGPPTSHPDDPASQQWHLRRARRSAEMVQVQALAAQGLSQRAIVRQTGRNRRTVRRWLTQDVPLLSVETPRVAAQLATGGEATSLRRRAWTPCAPKHDDLDKYMHRCNIMRGDQRQ